MHGEHLGHAVGDGRAGGEDDSAAIIRRLDVADFQIHVEGPLAGRLRQPGDARHLGNVKKIFEVVRLVYEDPVNAKFFEGQRVVFLVRGGEGFEFGLQPFFGFFQFLHQPPVVRVGVFPFDLFQFLQLLLEETLLGFAGQRDALETGVRDNDGIPIAGGDAAEKLLAVLRLISVCHEDVSRPDTA